MPSDSQVVNRYSGFRPEVQGLRAIAVLMVVVYHVFIGRVSGGVDIFLLISAFFMTLSFVRKSEDGRPLAIGRYWLHTFKRLLPLAAATILLTSIALGLWYPEWAVWAYRGDGLAALFYVENWQLAAVQADYYAADESLASPFQHFWSLSVQGQVFLIWPLIFGLAWLICRKMGWRPVRVLAVLFGLLFAGSLAYSVYITKADQQHAYFDTGARLWEFAFGSLLALAIPFVRSPKWTRVTLGWVGLAGMILCGIVLDVQGVFPGWIALWPLGSAAAIMIAGSSGSALGVDRFLSWSPVQRLGDSAYALYLVHWPILTTYRAVTGQLDVALVPGALLVLSSIGLAVVLTRFIDEPLRRWRWAEATTKHMAAVVAFIVMVTATAVGGWISFETSRLRQETEQARADFERNNPGARSLMDDFVYQGDPGAPVLPEVGELDDQWMRLSEACSGRFAPIEDMGPGYCWQTPTIFLPSRTVVVVGSSHAQQLLAALLPIAEERNWQLVALLQPGCSFGIGGPDPCPQTSAAFLRYLLEVGPDVVVTMATRTEVGSADGEHAPLGFDDVVAPLLDQDIAVVGIRDTPRFETSPVDCWTRQRDSRESCTVPTSELLAPVSPAEAWDDRLGYRNLDLTDLYCPDDECPVVIGNVLVWMDHDHLTKDYASTMAAPARDRVIAAVEELSF